jgi:transforming growth factor-beta-induced protein
MKIMNQITKIFAVLFLLFVSSCSNDDETTIERFPTAYEYIQKDTDSSIFLAAATKTGQLAALRGTSIFTLFVPSNSAFTSYTSTNFPTGITLANVATTAVLTVNQANELNKIIGYHFVSLARNSSDFKNAFLKTYARYESISTTPSFNALNMFVSNSSGVKINNYATVTEADINISNGYIHKIDKVLLLPKVNELISYHPDLTTFSNAIAANATVLSALSATGPVTVYAPINAAFLAPYASFVTSANTLDVLRYHYETTFRPASLSTTSASFLATTATADATVTTALTGKSFTIKRNGFKIADFNNTEGNIIINSVTGTNGTINVIDYVMKPF